MLLQRFLIKETWKIHSDFLNHIKIRILNSVQLKTSRMFKLICYFLVQNCVISTSCFHALNLEDFLKFRWILYCLGPMGIWTDLIWFGWYWKFIVCIWRFEFWVAKLTLQGRKYKIAQSNLLQLDWHFYICIY